MDASTSHSRDSYGEPRNLGLKHKIFLSHSGADKDFVRDLSGDLCGHSYSVFYDEESLPKAEIVTMSNILEEARDCQLAVFVLSDAFFVNTKNPMLELVACVEAERKLLPLFFTFTVEEFKDKNRREKWFRKWREWEQDPRVNLSKWKGALQILSDTNGVEYAKVAVNKKLYREAIVRTIFQLVPPYLPYDDSDIIGKERLCEVVRDMFTEASVRCGAVPRACAVGLYGIRGIGKTRLCHALVNSYLSEFQGNVCYVQLDSAPSPRQEELAAKRVKEVLERLTKASPQLVERVKHSSEGMNLLKENMNIRGRKVFLAIDNVGPTRESIEEARCYLRIEFEPGSKILITAHSGAVFSELGLRPDDPNCILNCFSAPMPDLEKSEAEDIFIDRAVPLSDKEHKLTVKLNPIVGEFVELCHIRKGGKPLERHYHPLLLVSLASLVESSDPVRWRSTLEKLRRKPTRWVDNEILSKLRISYDALEDPEKQVFLDIALYVPTNVRTDEEIYMWLQFVHGNLDMDGVLKELRKRSLLNAACAPCGSFSVHDLYRELAVKVVDEDACKSSFFLEGREGEPREVNQLVLRQSMQPKSSCLKRVGFVNCKFEDVGGVLDLSRCSGIEVLQLVGNEGLTQVNMHPGETLLLSLEVQSPRTTVTIQGFKDGSYLGWLHLENCEFRDRKWWHLWPANDDWPESLKALRSVEVKGTRSMSLTQLRQCYHLERLQICNGRGKLELNNFSRLVEMSLTGCDGVVELAGLSSLASLKGLSLWSCAKLARLSGLADLRSLERVRIDGCGALEKIECLLGASAVRLDDGPVVEPLPGCLMVVTDSHNLQEVTGLGSLRRLRDYRFVDCSRLEKIDGLGGPASSPSTSRCTLSLHKCNNFAELSHWRSLGQFRDQTSSYSGLVGNQRRVQYLEDLESLRELVIIRKRAAPSEAYSGIASLTSLEQLAVRGCALGWMEENLKLGELILTRNGDCRCDGNPPDFSRLHGLHTLMYHCGRVADVSSLSSCAASLQQLTLDGCMNVVSWPSFAQFTSLWQLDMSFTSLPSWPRDLPGSLRVLRVTGSRIPNKELVGVLALPSTSLGIVESDNATEDLGEVASRVLDSLPCWWDCIRKAALLALAENAKSASVPSISELLMASPNVIFYVWVMVVCPYCPIGWDEAERGQSIFEIKEALVKLLYNLWKRGEVLELKKLLCKDGMITGLIPTIDQSIGSDEDDDLVSGLEALVLVARASARFRLSLQRNGADIARIILSILQLELFAPPENQDDAYWAALKVHAADAVCTLARDPFVTPALQDCSGLEDRLAKLEADFLGKWRADLYDNY